MTTNELKQIKALSTYARETCRHDPDCSKAVKYIPALIAEVERYKGVVEEFEFIFRNKQSKPFRALHEMARKALEQP